jgi:hypothetical protein
MKLKSTLLYLLILTTFTRCPAVKAVYESLTNESGNTPNNIVFLGALTSKNQGQNNCATPSTTTSIGGGTFSKAQEISFYSSCKYYKTFYEVNGQKSANYIGSNSIQIPNGDLNPGVVSVVKLKYWSECYNDSGNTSKCSESETPKQAEYIFDTQTPNVELLSNNIFYLSNIANNGKATIQFRVSQSGSGNDEKEYSFEVIGEASKVLNSGTAIANAKTSFPLYASSLHVGENKLKLNVYDSLKNKSEILITIFLDDTLPNLISNRSSGLYGSDINIEFASATPEPFIGNICYTTNGTEPEMFPFDPESSLTNGNICKNGTIFTSKIKINKDVTLKYIARELSGNMSSVRTLSYSIDPNRPTVIIQSISNPYTKSTASLPLKFSSDKAGRYLIQTSDGTGENKKDPATGETKFYFKTKDIASGNILKNQEISLPILGQDLYNGQNILLVSVIAEKEVETSASPDTTKTDFTGLSQVDAFRDDTPPLSSIQPAQSEKIYNTAIVARITSEDNAKSYYSINNGFEQVYNASIGINIGNTSIVKYYSVDRAGNKETAKTITYNIDTIPPDVTISDIKPVDKRISMTLASLSKTLEFGVKSNELGRFEVLKGGCDGTKLITRTLEGSKVVPDFSAADFMEGYSSLIICVYDKAGNVTQKSLSNIFRDEKGNFAEVIDGNTNEVFKDFRAWEMPGGKPESFEGNNVLILTQGIVWMFDIRTDIDVPDNCRLDGNSMSVVCDYKKAKAPTELQAKFTVPSDINELAIANKANYSRIIYLAYPLGLRIEDRANAIANTYLKERLSATQLKAAKVDWVGLSEGTLVNLELINKFKDISDKRIFIAAPFQGSIYRDALAQGILGDENWALFKDLILKNAPEISQLLESSDYSKTRAPQLLSSLLFEDKSKSFLIPTNYKNLGIDLVVSIDSQTAGTPSPFDPNNIAVVAGSHFEMGNSPTKESIRLVVNSILQNGKIPSEINGDLAKNQVPVNYINGKWIAPINGNGGQEGTFTLEPNAGKVEMKILYDNPDWKVDSTIVVDSNTYKNGFIEVSTDLFILKKDVNAQINGPFKLEVVFDMERFKKTTNFTNRHPDFKEYPIHLYFAPKTTYTCVSFGWFGTICNIPSYEPWLLTTFPSLNVPVYINNFKLGFKDKIDFLISVGMHGNFYHKERPCAGIWPLEYCWDVEWKINGWSTLAFQYDKGNPNLTGNITMDFWGLGIDNMDFTGYISQRGNTSLLKTFFLDVPDSLEASLLFIKFPIDIRPVENMNLTLPVLDQNGEPVK